MKTIVLIGDSIRYGYQENVRVQLADWAKVLTPVQNGGTSAHVLAQLNDLVISRHADVVHINCGLHDIKKKFNQDTAAVPLSAYAENVRSILTRLQSETEASVVWALTTPVNQEWHHKNKDFDRFERDVLSYNAAASEICQELGVTINDLYSVVVAAGADTILIEDGVHFKPEGYALLGKSVAECIQSVSGITEQTNTADN